MSIATDEKFKLNINTKIGKVTDKTNNRYALYDPRLFVTGNKTGYIAATNGRALAITKPMDIDTDKTELPIPQSVLPTKKTQTRVDVLLGDNVIEYRSESGKYDTATDWGKYPKINDVIPDWYSSNHKVTIDVKLLHEIALAITPNGDDLIVTLSMCESGGPIAVSTDENGIGVLMPINDDPKDLAGSNYHTIKTVVDSYYND